MADAGVEAIAGVEGFVELFQRGLGGVEVADVVFGGVFGAFAVEHVADGVFYFFAVMALFHDVVLMEHVAEKMSVI